MRISNGTLILVLDGAKMLLLRNDGDEKYAVLSTLGEEVMPSPLAAAQGTDAPGRSFSSMGDRRSAYGETDWHQQDEDRFAERAAGRLRHAASEHECGIVVIAPPHTLGVLRKHYGAAVEQRLIAEIAKDLAGHVTDDIVRAIAAYGH